MRHKFLIGGAAAVALLIVALVIATRPSSQAAHHQTAGDSDPGGTNAPRMNPPSESGGPLPHVHPSPSQTPVVAAPPNAPDAGFRRIVHDHTGDKHPGQKSPINSDSVVAMRKAMIAPIRTCAQPALDTLEPDHAFRFSVQVTATVAEGKLALSNPKLVGAANTPLTQPIQDCILQAMGSLAFDAPEGQPDGQKDVLMPFNLP